MRTDLERYQILEEIGQGGFAVVYRARDTKLDRLVALKELHPTLLHDTEWVARFKREARTIARLNHPRIVTIFDVVEQAERLFIAMRLVEGPSLDHLLTRQGRLSWPQTLEIMTTLAEALDYAHAQNILHRDLKPANILLDQERGPQLSDFGLAKLAGEASSSVTAAGGIVGTPHYIAPEVWEGQGTSPQSDLYALGCILYEMVTGQKLFAGESAPAVMMAHFNPLTLPHTWPEETPSGLTEVLEIALNKQPGERYAKARELVAQLHKLTDHEAAPTVKALEPEAGLKQPSTAGRSRHRPSIEERPYLKVTAETFGAWLKLRRVALDLTQQELADQVGCSVVTIRKMEANERRPSKQLAGLLGTYLAVPETEQSAFIAFARREGPQPGHLSVEPSPWKSTLQQQLPPPHIPKPPTPFVGRQVELAAIEDHLKNPECQLLTLVGPGGIGKTRLAMEVAGALSSKFDHGVFFIPLAGLTTAQHIVPRIAETIRFTFSGQIEPKAQLFSYLRAKQMLLLLDNFEHLLTPAEDGATAGADLLADICAAAPGVKLLVTSRERLLLQSEWIYDVDGMRYPHPLPNSISDKAPRWEEVETYSAVQLFLSCARRVQTDFTPKEPTVSDVVRICRAVDGLPLGIELAAAWVRTLSLADIAAEIEHNLDLLTTSLRDVEPRHRNLQAVFDQSWRLLSKKEQDVLKRLAVFQGSFTREAANVVAQATLPLLSSLINKSLLKHIREEGRYELHELIKQVSLDKLQKDSDAEETARDRHSRFYAEFMQAREVDLESERDLEAVVAIEAEIDQVRAGWDWAVAQKEIEAIELYLTGLEAFYDIRGWYREGVEMFGQAMTNELDLEAPSLLQGKLLKAQGHLVVHLGQAEKAKALLEESLAIIRRSGSQADLVYVYLELGGAAMHREEPGEAKQWFLEALTTYEATGRKSLIGTFYQRLAWATLELGEPEETARYLEQAFQANGPKRNLTWVYQDLGRLAQYQGLYEEARRYFQEGVAICKKFGFQFALWALQHDLGKITCDQGAYQEAIKHFQESLLIAQTLDKPDLQTGSLSWLAYIAVLQDELSEAEKYLQENLIISGSAGHNILPWEHYWVQGEMALARSRYQQASAHFQQSLTLAKEQNRIEGIVWSLTGLGKVAVAQNVYDEAMLTYQKGLELAWKVPIIPEVLNILVELATVYSRQEEGERAAEITATALHHPGSKHESKDQARQLLAGLEAELSPDVMDSAIAHGQTQPLDQVVARLLSPSEAE